MARKKIKVSTTRPIGWTITDPARPGWSETGTTAAADLKERFKGGNIPQPKKSPAQLQREIDEALSRSPGSPAPLRASAIYEKGQRVAVLDDRGHEIGRGHVYSGDNYPEPNERTTWVKMTRHGETATEEWPTHRVVSLSRYG